MKSYYLVGLQPTPVTIQATIDPTKTASFDLTGLPEMATRETRVRVRSAIKQSGLDWPQGRVSVTVEPALPSGSAYTHLDLPIALAVLGLDFPGIVTGELSLTGAVRPVMGVSCIAAQGEHLLVPVDNHREAADCGAVVHGNTSLLQCVASLAGEEPWATPFQGPPDTRGKLCWSDVRGHERAKYAMEIAAAGGYNVALVGAPGTGKTMLARRLPTILPPMSEQESLEVTQVHSVAGLLPNGAGLMVHRPFRAPHHTCSAAALCGGGSTPRPGEVSLAHNGVLFLDELAEFPRAVLESARGPLEDGKVTVNRMRQSAEFPAKTMLVAAVNPCACGHYGDPERVCLCSEETITRYKSRYESFVAATCDVVVRLPPLSHEIMRGIGPGETGETVQARVIRAREFAATNPPTTLSPEGKDLLARYILEKGAPPQTFVKAAKVARTIANLYGEVNINVAHVAEALQYVGQE